MARPGAPAQGTETLNRARRAAFAAANEQFERLETTEQETLRLLLRKMAGIEGG
jgi:hypothetical protein